MICFLMNRMVVKGNLDVVNWRAQHVKMPEKDFKENLL